MRIVVEPKVYLVAATQVRFKEVGDYFDDLGVAWTTDPCSDGERLVEMAGRLCYRSWAPYDAAKAAGTNPNVKKIREGNANYIRNILESKHGSVLEHVTATFILKDVSRVLTHELVRHRAGMAYSQESLRYVRLTEIPFWIPETLKNPSLGRNSERTAAMQLLVGVIEYLEDRQRDLAELFQIDDATDFHCKKVFTSMFRRIGPLGLATTIMVTGNLRSWRHIIEQRTSIAAEEEIRLVIGKVAVILQKEYPAIFQDMVKNEDGSYTFSTSKV